MRWVSAQDAVQVIEPGDRVYLHGGAATPMPLVDALVARAPRLHDVEIVHIHTILPAPYAAQELSQAFRHNALFIGRNTRQAVADGHADYTPIFLSEIPRLFARGGPLAIDVALIQVSPPTAGGVCSLGISVDCALAAARHARTVIAVVNERMPRTGGHELSTRDIDFAVDWGGELATEEPPASDAVARAIGKRVAALVPDGATIQAGIGAIPNAALDALSDHQHLGMHTEMFSDGILPLVERGVLDGLHKTIDRGTIVSSFVVGSERLYRFLHDNPLVTMRPAEYTNDVDVIAAQHTMVAINSALSVDLTGQVVADSIGSRFYSGIGGQVDFIRGAARAVGGVPIIALRSTAQHQTISRITPTLLPGSGVVTTRGDVHWIVTEYGAVNLFGRSVRDRARLLISLAHPSFREELERGAWEIGLLGRRPLAAGIG